MIIDKKYPNHVIATPGKVLYRKHDNCGPFYEVVLGLYNCDGVIKEETVDDFNEIDDPNTPPIDENTEIVYGDDDFVEPEDFDNNDVNIEEA